MFAETSKSHHSTVRLKSQKPNLKHYFLRCSVTSTFVSWAYFSREVYIIRNRLTVLLLFVEESDLQRIGDVTDVTLFTLLTVASCTDKDKFCTVDVAGPTDQIKLTPFRCQITDKVGPVAISPGPS